MSVESPAEARQQLLPQALEHSINELGIRIAGGALVAFSVSSWLALLSWQLRDGRIAGTEKAARNLMGSVGAGLSDMMVSSLGVAVVFALICPMIWGLELLAGVRWLPRFRLKATAFVFALPLMAGAASALPPLPGWPLPGGSGGVLGDIVYNIAAAFGASAGLDRDGWTLFGLLAGTGLGLLLRSVGFGREHLAWPRLRRKPAADKIATGASAGPAVDLAAPGFPSTPAEPAAAARAPLPAGPAPTAASPTAASPTAAGPEIAPAVVPAVAAAMAAAFAATAAAREPTAEDDIDQDEDAESIAEQASAFAARFAPRSHPARAMKPVRLGPAVKATIARARQGGGYRKPSLNLLRRGPDEGRLDHADVETGARTLLEVLEAFGVKGEIREARPGPVVTRYELEPVRGTKLARVIGLADDFARELGVNAVRVAATPGRTTIGIEVPNAIRQPVGLREVLESEPYAAGQSQLPLALGRGISGEPVVVDLARLPHVLVAGTTGSGKSVGLHAMIVSLLYRHEPADLRLLMIDPKMLELTPYDRIPHLLSPVITDPQQAAHALEWAVSEMEERYKRMARHGVRSIEAFNARVRAARATGRGLERTTHTGYDDATGEPVYEREQLDDAPMPAIVVVIDELADLMVTAGRRVEAAIQRLAQKARAAGIHLVMATQRPSVDVVTGTIKANVPARISFRVASRIDSRTILGETGAEQLLGHGDMLIGTGSGQLLRVHGALVTEDEVERVTEALRAQGEPVPVEALVRGPAAAGPAGAAPRAGRKVADIADARAQAEAARFEELLGAAVEVVLADRKVSPGHLHRRMGIPEDLAGELIERMERDGIVGPVGLLGRRSILRTGRASPAEGRTVA